ncbi:dihydroxyacetone kinase subunit DhaL [Actinomyces howellii]|uniref:PTS-dependent dihydroxyacetone kinase, ADP-binding subunit dhaL n=1 Tax=Actinomyces howellii TaxID=52771 RepID=A0A448HFB7_9ACTO|nr:dihydroxyacetone kinase subunit DhaL [Actinomyces howellii]VEG26998.1 PTS-dependent dihydroxyacetone kinase, ADP-binding subunit dhaL [Actinomyces howellii]
MTADKLLDTAWVVDWTRRSAAAVTESIEELNALDAAIGDGDHGTNLCRGLEAALAKLDAAAQAGDPPPTPGGALKAVATSLLATVGGASGPLLGTAYLRASRGGTLTELDAAAVAGLIEDACAGVEVRGRAEAGDKTMLDAWRPAAVAARSAADRGAGPAEVLAAAARAAAQGAQSTEPMTARKGRASYHGVHSQGHRDPGAQSTAILLEAACHAAGA